MLCLEQVSAGYGKNKTVLHNISFSLAAGKLTVLIGKNGCGKSTLLSCVNRTVKYKGEIYLDEENIAELSVREMAQRVILLPQTLKKVHLTVRELVMLGRSPHLAFGARLEKRDYEAVEYALNAVDMTSFANEYADRLSGGERQKAYLAMVLAVQAPLMLLDEPTTYMDIACKTEFMRLIKRINREEGKTLLIVTHDLESVLKYADNILIMEQGRIVFNDTVEKCMESDVLETCFGVRRRIVSDSDGQYVIFEE